MDASNFLKNGLANVEVDPDKVNKLLTSVPIKVVQGKVSEVKLTFDAKSTKLEVNIGKVSLDAYLDDHSQFKQDFNIGSNFVVGEQ